MLPRQHVSVVGPFRIARNQITSESYEVETGDYYAAIGVITPGPPSGT